MKAQGCSYINIIYLASKTRPQKSDGLLYQEITFQNPNWVRLFVLLPWKEVLYFKIQIIYIVICLCFFKKAKAENNQFFYFFEKQIEGAFVCASSTKKKCFFLKKFQKKVLIEFLMLFVCASKKKVEAKNNQFFCFFGKQIGSCFSQKRKQ